MNPPFWLGWAVLAACGLVAAQVLFLPVPSPVGAGRRLRTWWGHGRLGGKGTWGGAVDVGLGFMALSGVFPTLLAVLVPFGSLEVFPFRPVSGAAAGGAAVFMLTAGCCLVYLGAVALRQETNFSGDGDGHGLVTRGVFSFIRHPIAGGLGLVYAGLVAAAPSVWGGFGMGAFLIHMGRQIQTEEALLAARFGRPYEAYRKRTGMLMPRLRGSASASADRQGASPCTPSGCNGTSSPDID